MASGSADQDEHDCAILFFPVPGPPEQPGPEELAIHGMTLLVDDLTHRWGYSHVALDCSEFRRNYADRPQVSPKDCDAADGARFAVQARRKCGVHGIAVADLNQRKHGRVDLADLGLECGEVCKAACDAIGKPFSMPKWATGGLLDWSGYVCVDVVTRGLGVDTQKRIYDALKRAYPRSPLLCRKHDNQYLFSPNGLALACGLDRADGTITGYGVPLAPRPLF